MSKFVILHEFHLGSATYTIYEGKNATGNNYILDTCDSGDLWFHVNGSSSAHVVVRLGADADADAGKIPKQVIKRCCCICKASTRTSDKVEIVYTERGNLEKLNDVGTVSFLDMKKVKKVSL